LKLPGPYKPLGAKSYRVKGVSRSDHEKITTEPENRLSRSAAGLTRPRNPKPRRVTVIQITVILWAGTPDARLPSTSKSPIWLAKSPFRASNWRFLTCG